MPAKTAVAAPAPEPHFLSREEILAAQDIETATVAVPEWGGSLRIKTMTGRERDAMEMANFTAQRSTDLASNVANIRARLVARTAVDEAGHRLFSDEDVVALGEKSGAALDRAFGVANRLNKLAVADIKELLDQLGKGLSAGSGSGSPGN